MSSERSNVQLDPTDVDAESASASCASTSAETSDTTLNHPWLYLAKMFAIRSVVGHTYRLQCLLCLPKTTECSAYFNSPSYFKKHIERLHPAHKEEFEKLVASGRKWKADTIAGNAEKKRKQPTIEAATRSANTVMQKQVNTAVLNFVVGGLMPLSVVELQEFKELIVMLQPNLPAMSRVTLRLLIIAEAATKKEKLLDLLKGQEFVATTTDCWSTYVGKLYLGVTVHWIANALRRMKGSHTYDVIAAALDDLHAEYGIGRKIVRTTTDNGSNFVKAFTVYMGS